jgi:acyl carrier protein
MSDAVKGTTATQEEVLLAVRELIADRLEIPLDEVPADAPLFELSGMDSLKLMHGMLLVEQRFGVTVDTNKAITVQTVQDLTDLVVTSMDGN